MASGTILRREFKSARELKELLAKKFSDENFNNAIVKIIFNDKVLKNYLFITDKNFWFVIDNGHRRKAYKVEKSKLDINFDNVENYEDYGKLTLPKIPYPIMYSNTLTGGTSSFVNYIKSMKDE